MRRKRELGRASTGGGLRGHASPRGTEAVLAGLPMKRRGEAGQSLVLVALVMVVLIAFLGFAIDFGYYRFLRRQLQTAADAAALAGAMDFTYGDYSAAGQAASAENGFTNGAGGITVTMSKPPTTGPYAGAAGNYVQATVTDTAVPTFFSKVFGATAPHLSATAVAEGGINCLYGLDTAANSPFTLTVSAVDLQCGVVSNNTFVLNGGLLCAPSIQSVNWPAGTPTCGLGFTSALPVKIPSAVTDPFCPASGCTLPQPSPAALPPKGSCSAGVYKVPPKPLAITQALTYTANYCGIQITSSGTTANPVTFAPGNYYGPITVNNSVVTFQTGTYAINSPTQPGITLSSSLFGNSQLNFQSGNYTIAGGIQDNSFTLFGSFIDFNSTPGSTQSLIILDGGGLNLVGGLLGGTAAKSTGGVTIFNTGSGTGSCATCYGQIISTFSFSGTFCGAKCTLNPSTSGLYPGILFFQDRTYTYSAACPFGGSGVACFGVSFNVNPGTVAHNGTYYFPTNTVNFDFDFGAGTTWNYLIAKDVKWFVGFTFNSNTAAVPTTFPLRQGSAALVQ